MPIDGIRLGAGGEDLQTPGRAGRGRPRGSDSELMPPIGIKQGGGLRTAEDQASGAWRGRGAARDALGRPAEARYRPLYACRPLNQSDPE